MKKSVFTILMAALLLSLCACNAADTSDDGSRYTATVVFNDTKQFGSLQELGKTVGFPITLPDRWTLRDIRTISDSASFDKAVTLAFVEMEQPVKTHFYGTKDLPLEELMGIFPENLNTGNETLMEFNETVGDYTLYAATDKFSTLYMIGWKENDVSKVICAWKYYSICQYAVTLYPEEQNAEKGKQITDFFNNAVSAFYEARENRAETFDPDKY